jgi:predicted esterase
MKDGIVALDGVKMPLHKLRGDVALEDDMLIGELTVKESLRAALNLKRKLNKDEVRIHTDMHLLCKSVLNRAKDWIKLSFRVVERSPA